MTDDDDDVKVGLIDELIRKSVMLREDDNDTGTLLNSWQ
jgi:hypothetical protein